MDQPTPALTGPNDTGTDDAQQTGDAAQAPIYSPLGADRGPTREEIETWRRTTYDELIARSAASGEPTGHGSLAEHQAATATGAIYMAWTKVMDRAEREDMAPGDAAGLIREAYVAVASGRSFDADTARLPSEPAPSIEEFTSDGQPFTPGGTDQDGDAVDVDLVELGQRYEELRLLVRDSGAQGKVYSQEKAKVEREFLHAMVDSGHASISLILPGSGENRVLTPTAKVWPKVREDESVPADESGKRPLIDVERRMQAIVDAGLGHLLVTKIDDKGLRETFEGYASEEDMPDELRKVYTITRQWSLSSAKGRAGRVSGPSADEVAQGKAPRANTR